MAICTPEEIYKSITQIVYNEEFGTGDNSTTIFYLKIEDQQTKHEGLKIIENSESIFINDVLVPNTNYSIDYFNGQITFDTAPATDDILTATFEFSLLKRITSRILEDLIKRATNFIKNQMKGYAIENTSETEFFEKCELIKQGIETTGYYCCYKRELLLSHIPVLGITQIIINGTDVTTEADYVLLPDNFPQFLKLRDRSFSGDTQIVYTHGFDINSTKFKIKSIAEQIKELCILLVFLDAAGVNIYSASWRDSGFINFGSIAMDRGIYQTAGEAELTRKVERLKEILTNLPNRIGVG